MANKIYFAENIWFLRKKKGLTQMQLAKELKITRSRIEGYWHIGESFTKMSGQNIQTNFVGVQVLFRL